MKTLHFMYHGVVLLKFLFVVLLYVSRQLYLFSLSRHSPYEYIQRTGSVLFICHIGVFERGPAHEESLEEKVLCNFSALIISNDLILKNPR